MSTFDKALKIVFGMEGDYSNHKHDPGGKTKFGITEDVARQWGYQGPMAELPHSTAREIMRDRYWSEMGCGQMAHFSEPLAIEVFEFGVNAGTATAIKKLQHWLNILSRRGRDYDEISVDGVFGPETHGALMGYSSRRNTMDLVRALNASQIEYYRSLVEQDPRTYSPFINGWIRQRGSLDIYNNL